MARDSTIAPQSELLSEEEFARAVSDGLDTATSEIEETLRKGLLGDQLARIGRPFLGPEQMVFLGGVRVLDAWRESRTDEFVQELIQLFLEVSQRARTPGYSHMTDPGRTMTELAATDTLTHSAPP